MNLPNKDLWIILAVLILLGIAVLLRIPQSEVSAGKENQQPDAESMKILQVFAEAHINAVSNVGDSDFTAYVTGPLQKICPFYVPDGVSYRDCLGDLVERGTAAYGGSKSDITGFETYCRSISEQYEAWVESLNLYYSCMAYKLGT
ncbi:MAG: hypothetical protein Q7R79_02655 [bacterium]|nr:hypothetical protein [bacterium]